MQFTVSVEAYVIGLKEVEEALEFWPEGKPDPTITYEAVTIEKAVFVKIGFE